MSFKDKPTMSDPLLTYEISTYPDPLQASPQTGDASLATLTIIVSNPTRNTIDCSQISFGFLKGTNANEFFSDSTGIATTPPPGWTINQDVAAFTATPDTTQAGEIGPDGLVFVLANIKVNTQPGSTLVTITEKASQPGGTTPAPAATRKEKKELPKFPPQFEVGDLNASMDTVQVGDSTVLTWSGSSGATYELHYTDADENLVVIDHPQGEPDQPLPSTGSYQIDDLQRDTTFYLVVTLPVEGQDEPLKVERHFPVTVEIPNVKIKSFTADPAFIFRLPGATTTTPVSVTLAWDTVGANQFLLNGNIVDGQSTTVVVSEETTFTLEATGSPFPVFKQIKVKLFDASVQLSLPSGGTVEVTFDASPGTYIVNMSAKWETGETAGTATNSITVNSPGGSQSVTWQVPMDMPPPYGGVVSASCSISGYPGGTLNAQWSMSSLAETIGSDQTLQPLSLAFTALKEISTTSNTLLTYAISTDPDPLQASPQTGAASLAKLTIIVSNSTRNTIDCSSITFSFLKGTNANQFFSESTGIATTAPPGWTITQDEALFTATPDTAPDGQIGLDGLIFLLSDIQVNTQPGTSELTITEVASQPGGPTPATRKTRLQLAKFPPDFTVGDLNASSLTVPQGGSTTLSWGGSEGATYVLQYDDVVITKTEDGHLLPATGSYTVNNLQNDPTIFYLVVTYQPPNADPPVVAQRNCPVTVLIEPVALANFIATPAVVFGLNNNVPVTLSWDATAAHQLVLNNDIVSGSSAIVNINDTTEFLLTATGYQGPVFSQCEVTVEPVNPIFIVSGGAFAFAFMANAGPYQFEFSTSVTTGNTTETTETTDIVQPGSPAQVVLLWTPQNSMIEIYSPNSPVTPTPPASPAGATITYMTISVVGFASGPLTQKFPS